MQVLITRPEPDAAALAARLAALGFTPVIAPLMHVVFRDAVPDLGGVAALAFTSANGVRAFARVEARRGLTVFAVGKATADAARAAGFSHVIAAGGDVDALAATIAAEPPEGIVLHIAGRELRGDLAVLLEARGVSCRRAVLYAAEAAPWLPEAAAAVLRAGTLDAALFYSPRTARLFAERVGDAGLRGACARVTAVALSPAVAQALEPIRFAAVAVADRPEEPALIAALERVRGAD